MKVFYLLSMISCVFYIIDKKKHPGFLEGIKTIPNLILSMAGLLILSGELAQRGIDYFYRLSLFLHRDPSFLPSLLIAPDMGAYTMATILAKSYPYTVLNGVILSALVGVNISFNIPITTQFLKDPQQSIFLKGLLFGLIISPIGYVSSGILLGIQFQKLIWPFLGILFFGILIFYFSSFPKGMKIFSRTIVKAIKVLNYFGLLWGMLAFIMSWKLYVPLKDSLFICVRIGIVLCGTYFMFNQINQYIKNEQYLLFWISTISIIPAITKLKDHSKKEIFLLGTFCCSGAYLFGGQLAYVLSMDERAVPLFLFSKLMTSIIALICGNFYYQYKIQKNDPSIC